MLIHTLFK